MDWNETLTTDLLTVARVVKTTIPGGDPGPSIGPDVNLTNITLAYQTDLAALLALGTTDEAPSPPIVIAGATGDPVALLVSLLPGVPAFEWPGRWLPVTSLLVLGLGIRGRSALTR